MATRGAKLTPSSSFRQWSKYYCNVLMVSNFEAAPLTPGVVRRANSRQLGISNVKPGALSEGSHEAIGSSDSF